MDAVLGTALLYLQALAIYGVAVAAVALLRPTLPVLVGMYTTLLTLSQFLSPRLSVWGIASGPGGVVTFTATLAVLDMIVIRYGLGEARRAILVGLATQALVVVAPYALVTAPPMFPDDAWRQVALAAPRIAVASVVAYLVSESINAYLTHRFRNRLWQRTFMSDPLALVVDTAVFMTIAFSLTLPPDALLTASIGQVTAKLLLTPANYAALRITRKIPS